MRAIPERLRDVSYWGAIQIDYIYLSCIPPFEKNSSKFVESFLSYPVIVYGKNITSLAKVVITYVDKKEDDHSAAVPWWRVASAAAVAAADR